MKQLMRRPTRWWIWQKYVWGYKRKARPFMDQVAVQFEGLRKFMADHQRVERRRTQFLLICQRGRTHRNRKQQ
ncbi:unnamed protein product [Prunus armeniaca]